jgi:hypothetical protein
MYNYTSATSSASPFPQPQTSRLDRARQQAEPRKPPGFWNPKNGGEHVDGIIVKITEGQANDRGGGKFDVLYVHVKNGDGEIQIIAAGRQTTLGKKLLKANIKPLGHLCVLFVGEKTSNETNRTYKDWSVVFDAPTAPGNQPSLLDDDDLQY